MKCLLRATILLVPLLLVLCAPAQGSENELTLRGTITFADHQTYVEVPFEVGENIARVTVDFSYTERDKRTTIDLGIFDGERFRGWSGGNKSSFTLAESDATPSYLPGPIRPGTWKLILGVPNIRQGIRATYEAHVHLSRIGEVPAVSTFSAAPIRSEPGWFRGDLHMHDAHSDGSCLSQSGKRVPCPLYRTVEAAARRGLDFIAISDHNTTSHYNEMRELQPYFDRLLLIPAREITTFQGHANVFGPTRFIDFRLTSPSVPDFNHLLTEVNNLHGILSINHPGLPSGEDCMGCGWTVPHVDFSRIAAIEAVNGGRGDGPLSGIPFWQKHLNQGFRLTGLAGSDNHNADDKALTSSAIGHPMTVVYAADLSENSILNAIRAGHVFLDLGKTVYDGADTGAAKSESEKRRLIEFTATVGSKTAMMGDALSLHAGQQVEFALILTNLESTHVEIVEDGEPTALLSETTVREAHESRSFKLTSDGKRHWIRVNVREENNSLVVVGNPIYLNF